MVAMQRAVPVESITELIRRLVRIPSRAGEDDLARICQCVEDWLRGRGMDLKVLPGRADERLGIYCEIGGATPGPWTVLNATLDTAGFGELASWSFGPTEAHIADGWLHGRGSADSKAAVALFCHLLVELQLDHSFAGRIGVLFDCDEHSGHFGGARAFFDQPYDGQRLPRPDGVLIGYPGMNQIVSGCRGFLRCRLQVHGIAAHSGSAHDRGVNAVSRALALAQRLQSLPLPAADDDFPLPPQVTITGIRGGGEGFSQIPDLCELKLDMRLTPAFTDASAREAVGRVVGEVDAQCPQARRTQVIWHDSWPAYRVPDSHPLVSAMRAACRAQLGADLPVGVIGPSNIGNYLSSLGVPALCGFGVRDEGIHAANERIELATIEPAYQVYRDALRRLHHT
jgi:succinyl-diaminopimelate desuccinylase